MDGISEGVEGKEGNWEGKEYVEGVEVGVGEGREDVIKEIGVVEIRKEWEIDGESG